MDESPTLPPMTFGERLRTWRKARKLSQQQVADRLDHPQAWISNRERGHVVTSVDEAREILAAMGYAGDFVVVEGEHGALLRLLAAASPAEGALALKLLEALPRMNEGQRAMLTAMIQAAADQAPPAQDELASRAS